MTTGTIINNNWTPVVTSCGPGNIGFHNQKSWTGGDDPLHRSINAYSMTRTAQRDSLIEWVFNNTPNNVYTGTYVSCFGGIVADDCTLSDNDELTLLNRLGESIRGHTFDAANSFGAEGRDALKQIADAAGSFYHGVKQLKRGNVGGALANFGLNPKMEKNVGLHKSLSGKVLATQLGWLPLLGDIKSATEALDAIVSRPLERTYSAKVKVKGYCHPASRITEDIGFAQRSKKLTWTLSVTPTFAGQLSISNPWDIADMAWNAATLSFVYDWFMPVGDYLNAQSIVTEFKGSGFFNLRYKYHASTTMAALGHSIVSGNPYEIDHVEFSRVPVSTLTVPLPKFRDFKKVPSWARALTAVTLAAQILL